MIIALLLLSTTFSAATKAQETPETPETTTTAPLPEESADQKFKRGKGYFEYRDCPGTIAAVSELAVPGQLSDEKDQLEVHRMLGICHALVDSPDHKREAAREFSSLLSIDPDFQLDPFEVPPHVVEVFETQKTAMKARLDEIRRARANEDNFADGGVLVERTTEVRVTPFSNVFLPFGLAQLSNGDLVKAGIFGGVQGVALAVDLVGFVGVTVLQAQTDGGFVVTPEQKAAFDVFWGAQAVGVAVLGIAYIGGVSDAWYNREEQAVLAEKQTKRPLTSSELKKLKRIERAPDPETTPAPAP